MPFQIQQPWGWGCGVKYYLVMEFIVPYTFKLYFLGHDCLCQYVQQCITELLAEIADNTDKRYWAERIEKLIKKLRISNSGHFDDGMMCILRKGPWRTVCCIDGLIYLKKDDGPYQYPVCQITTSPTAFFMHHAASNITIRGDLATTSIEDHDKELQQCVRSDPKRTGIIAFQRRRIRRARPALPT